MSIAKLIADMDVDIVDLSEDEITEETRVKSKHETVLIDSNQNETKTEVPNKSEVGIDWGLLGIESDTEEVETKKQSEESGSSILLLEAGNGSLVLSNGEDDMREKGDDKLKGLSENMVVCSSESRVSSEKMTAELILVSEDEEVKNENLDLDLSMGEDNSKGLSEKSAISDAENKDEFAKKSLELVLVSADNEEMENENIQVLNKNLDLESENSENLALQLVSFSEDKETGIGNKEGINENSALDTYATDSMCLDPGEGDDKGPSGNSVVSCIEMKNEKMEGADANVDSAPQEGVNSEVLIKTEGAIANSSVVKGDSETNCLELVLDTGVQNTIVGAIASVEKNRDQTEKNDLETAELGSGLRSLSDKKTPKKRGRKPKGKKMNDANTNLALVVYNYGENSNSREKRERKESKYLSHPYTTSRFTPKRTKRENMTNGEGERVKTGDDDKEVSPENVVSNLISIAQNPSNPDQSNLTKAARGILIAFRQSVCCKEIVKKTPNVKKSRNKELRRVYTHEEPAALLVKFRPGANIPSKEDLIAKFTKFGALILSETNLVQDGKSARVTFARKKDGQVAFDSINGSGDFEMARLRFVSPIEVPIAPPPVLLDARDKFEEIVASLNGSNLERKESLIGETMGLLEKVNSILTKDGMIGSEV